MNQLADPTCLFALCHWRRVFVMLIINRHIYGQELLSRLVLPAQLIFLLCVLHFLIV